MEMNAVKRYQEKASRAIREAGIALTDREAASIEICDYGLGEYETIGTSILTYVNTDRVCAKEIVLFPWQICPEHIHPALGDYPGKEETFRCRKGEVYLYVTGEAAVNPVGRVPENRRDRFTVWHEIILKPGQQYTLRENTNHWFQAGPQGAIVSEFSTQSYDDKDIFIDPDIQRKGFA